MKDVLKITARDNAKGKSEMALALFRSIVYNWINIKFSQLNVLFFEENSKK